MNKLYIVILAFAIFIIAFIAAVYFPQWCALNNGGPQEAVKAVEPDRDDGRISNEHISGVTSEERPEIDKRRLNIVLLGIEGKERADTIIFISYDIAARKLDIISIPRDTYFYESGYNRGDQRKINAVYGREREEGCVDAVGKLLCNTIVDYYVSSDYEGVEKIIDTIEGVEIEVPLDMEVGGIKINEGRQVLYGKEALQYLRFRKKYPDGDLGRIKAQQRLIKAALSKVKLMDIPGIISKSIWAMNTNMSVKEMLKYAGRFKADKVEEVSIYILPGVAMYKNIDGYNWSYFFHNPEKVKELIDKIYGIESFEQKKRKRFQQ